MFFRVPTRRCPRCRALLTELKLRDTLVDFCRHCGGTWLDAGEAGQAIGVPADPEVWKYSSVDRATVPSGLACPVDGAQLERHTVAFEKDSVDVDICAQCNGLWLDEGECRQLADIVLNAGQDPKTGLAPKPTLKSYLFQLLLAIPLEVWHPTSRRPVVTRLLLLTMAGLFIATFGSFLVGAEWARLIITSFGLTPATFSEGGHYHTLLTHALLHLSIAHLLGNMWFLYVFGDNVEDALGPARFLGIFAAAAIAGGLLHLATQGHSQLPLVGASGAISGLMGAYLGLFPRAKVYVIFFFIRFRFSAFFYMAGWIALQALLMLGDPQLTGGVAWGAHVGGFVTGLIIARTITLPTLTQSLSSAAARST